MERGAHVAFSAMLGVVAAGAVWPGAAALPRVLGASLGAAAGLMPDLDLHHKHRMLLHNIWAAILASAAAYWASGWLARLLGLQGPLAALSASAVAAGYLGHLFLDALTVSGVALLYPFTSRRLRLARLRSSSRAANLAIEVLSVAAAALVMLRG